MAEHPSGGTPTTLEAELKSQLQESASGGAPVRNINYDTHLGHAAQRPYARLEDQIASLVTGWQSYEQLRDRLAGTVDGPIFQDKDGIWKHKRKPVATGTMREGPNGLERGLMYPARAVALTQDEAKAKTAGGFPTDYHNGNSWVWGGNKAARDYQVMADQAANHPAENEIEWEPVDPMTQAGYRAQQTLGGLAMVGSQPVVVTKADSPQANKKDDK